MRSTILKAAVAAAADDIEKGKKFRSWTNLSSAQRRDIAVNRRHDPNEPKSSGRTSRFDQAAITGNLRRQGSYSPPKTRTGMPMIYVPGRKGSFSRVKKSLDAMVDEEMIAKARRPMPLPKSKAAAARRAARYKALEAASSGPNADIAGMEVDRMKAHLDGRKSQRGRDEKRRMKAKAKAGSHAMRERHKAKKGDPDDKGGKC